MQFFRNKKVKLIAGIIFGTFIVSVAIIAGLKVYKHNILKIDFDKRREPLILENIEEIIQYETPEPTTSSINSDSNKSSQSPSAVFKKGDDRFEDDDD